MVLLTMAPRNRQPGYRFFLFAVTTAGGRVRSFLLRTRGMIVSRSRYGKAPTRQLHSRPIAVSGSGLTRKRHQFMCVQENPLRKRLVLSKMHLTLRATRPTPPGASRLGRRSTIEVHPKHSEGPHLRSFIPHPKTDGSKN